MLEEEQGEEKAWESAREREIREQWGKQTRLDTNGKGLKHAQLYYSGPGLLLQLLISWWLFFNP